MFFIHIQFFKSYCKIDSKKQSAQSNVDRFINEATNAGKNLKISILNNVGYLNQPQTVICLTYGTFNNRITL